MNVVTISSKGQIKLSEEVLRHLGVRAHDKVSVDMRLGGEIRLRAVGPSAKISDAFGCLKREGQRPISIEEMNDIIEKAWAGQL